MYLPERYRIFAITTQKIADEAITKDKLEKDIQKRLTAEINDLLGLNLSDNPLERIRNDAGLMTVFRHVGCIGDSLASGEAVYKKSMAPQEGRICLNIPGDSILLE